MSSKYLSRQKLRTAAAARCVNSNRADYERLRGEEWR